MRRVLLFALCALLLSPGVAAAKTGKKIGKSPAEIEAYWTAERMKDAKPVGRVKPSANAKRPSGGGGFQSSEAFPYDKAEGKLFFTDNGARYVCSGTAVENDVVWTAGHCVKDGGSGENTAYYSDFMFVPAYKNGQEPYGRFGATDVETTPGWANQMEYGVDLGAIKVQGLSTAIGGATKVVSTQTDQVKTGSFVSYGYPAGSPFNGQLQWTCSATVSRLDSGQSPPTMGLPCDMTGGSSGGGWLGSFGGGVVYSVNSYGYRTVKNTMFGPVQGTAAGALYADIQQPD